MSTTQFPFRAVVFDLDGTLADSLNDIAGAMNEALVARGFAAHSIDSYRFMIGEGVEQLARRAIPTEDLSLIQSVVAEYRALYAQKWLQRTQPYDGVNQLLNSLTASAIPVSILSNKRDDLTSAMVENLFSSWPFVEVRGERTGVPRKPHPQAALELANRMKVQPHECAFVGDTAVDMQTAVAAGMIPVGVLWGFRDALELRANGARALVAHPMELLEIRI